MLNVSYANKVTVAFVGPTIIRNVAFIEES